MKRIIAISIALIFFMCINANAQLGGVLNKAKDKANQRANEKVDQGIDKGLDKTEEGIKKDNEKKDNGNANDNANTSNPSATTQTTTTAETKKSDLVAYGKYDFVPGDKIIFEDHVEGETLGEFPSKWDLRNGKIEIAAINGEQVIAFLEGNYATITPLIAKPGDYLPDQFSLEFDHYVKEGGYATMELHFGDDKNEKYDFNSAGEFHEWVTVGGSAHIGVAHGSYTQGDDYKDRWHHIAISYNKGNVKIYTDEKRLCNLPHGNGNPQQVVFGCIGSEESPIYIKNIRITEGGGDLYKRVTTDGKFITHGILFDVNKSSIKPQSMGTLNDILKLMKDHPELKFEVDGHTDSDGDDAANLKLSQARADAVKAQLVQMGIDASRLTTKGFGKNKPVDLNTTPEGKANNRRVEFVKI